MHASCPWLQAARLHCSWKVRLFARAMTKDPCIGREAGSFSHGLLPLPPASIAEDVEVEVPVVDFLVGAFLADLLDGVIEGLAQVVLAFAHGNADTFAMPLFFELVGTYEVIVRPFLLLE